VAQYRLSVFVIPHFGRLREYIICYPAAVLRIFQMQVIIIKESDKLVLDFLPLSRDHVVYEVHAVEFLSLTGWK
jgi:hypothetical protein